MNQDFQIEVPGSLIQVLTPAQAWEYEVLPARKDGEILEVYLSKDKEPKGLANELEILVGLKIEFKLVDAIYIAHGLKKYYPKNSGYTSTLNNTDLLDNIIQEAWENESSDIHFETYEDECRVRIRIDGVLVEKFQIPEKEYLTLINKIKIKSNLNIAEKRLPQDGRILFDRNGLEFDIRVSILPTLNGEKVVLRLLQKEAAHLSLESLGLNENQIMKYREGIRKSHGIVLISGPTGSGKTTTLYATLKEINDIRRNILTIEDPIEYTLKGINQVQLKEKIGLTFAAALRTFLRQDPDTIMLGEIRDPETAQMATRASLTGHLVFSTIHTNSAFGIINRLVDMGVPPYLIASTLTLAVAQRLVRLLCPDCKSPVTIEKDELPAKYRNNKLSGNFFRAEGCQLCNHTGYRGRKAIYEIISIDDDISEKIRHENLDIDYLTKNHKMITLSDSALNLLSGGQTSLSEIYPILISNMN